MSEQGRFVLLSHIRLREDLWPRAGYAEDQIKEWVRIYQESGRQWCWPVVLLREVPGAAIFDIEDGANRVELAKRLGLDSVPAVVRSAISDRDLRYQMVRHSSIGSKMLSAEEKLGAIRRLKDDGWNYSDIAKAIGVTRKTIHAWLKYTKRPSGSRDRGGDRRDDPIRRYTRSVLSSVRSLFSEIEPDREGNRGEGLSMALMCGAEELFGDEAGHWLRCLERCFGAAADGIEADEE